MIKHLFWVLWTAEFIFVCWMLWDEMKIKHLPMPMYIPLGFLWLLVSLVVKFVMKSESISLTMVAIPGVPLMIMGFFLLVVFIINIVSGPIRWN